MPLARLASLLLGLLGLLGLTPLALAVAPGQFRAYLSTGGSDANPCTLPAPCRLLPAALAAVADGGEVWMLDSANYNTGPVAFTKSVTVLAVPGVLGSLVASGGNAVEIATPAVEVTLRNVTIRPLPGNEASTGIRVTADAKVTLQDSALFGFSAGTGLSLGAANSAANAHADIVDSTLRGNGTAISAFSGARALVLGSQLRDGTHGVVAATQVNAFSTLVALEGSTIANMTGTGISASSPSNNLTARVLVSRSRLEGIGTAAISIASVATNPDSVQVSLLGTTIARSVFAVSANGSGATVVFDRAVIVDNDIALSFQNNAKLVTSATSTMRRNGTQNLPATTTAMEAF